jgi:dihydroneopterin aldolase
MTRLLASVTSVSEAAIALEGGADIIDLKNPSEGALGALPIETIREIVTFVDGRVPVSATIGDLPMQPLVVSGMVSKTAETGVDIVKIGLFGREGHADCIDAISLLTRTGVRVVAVLFADDQPDFGMLPVLSRAGFYGVMLDTVYKGRGGLTDCLPGNALDFFVSTSRELGLLSGLAGSLRAEDVPELASIAPDYLGFRGGVCLNDDRNMTFDHERLMKISHLLHKYNNRVQNAASFAI